MITPGDNAKAFLGRGWRFPVSVDPGTGRIAISEFEQDIRESIKIILRTAPGERVMRPDFGCGIHDLVFASMNSSTLGLIESNIRQSIIQFEPRVEILNVEITAEEANGNIRMFLPGALVAKLSLRIRDTNHEFNMVYPFYLREGTP